MSYNGVEHCFLILLAKGAKKILSRISPFIIRYSNWSIHVWRMNYREMWSCINRLVSDHYCHIWLHFHFLVFKNLCKICIQPDWPGKKMISILVGRLYKWSHIPYNHIPSYLLRVRKDGNIYNVPQEDAFPWAIEGLHLVFESSS